MLIYWDEPSYITLKAYVYFNFSRLMIQSIIYPSFNCIRSEILSKNLYQTYCGVNRALNNIILRGNIRRKQNFLREAAKKILHYGLAISGGFFFAASLSGPVTKVFIFFIREGKINHGANWYLKGLPECFFPVIIIAIVMLVH